MYLQVIPIYGFIVGFNYWNSKMDDIEDNETEHLFQLMIGIFGISFHLWKKD